MRYPNATRRIYVLGALFLAIIYLGVGYYPFHIKPFANTAQVNGAVRLPDGGIRFPATGIAYTEEAPVWLRGAIATSQLEIYLEIRTTNHEQTGVCTHLYAILRPLPSKYYYWPVGTQPQFTHTDS